MKKMSETIYIVLASPDDSGNIGSVCRAMKTMGIKHLRIVNPPNYDENKIRYTSIHAFDIFQNRTEYSSLKEALSDLSFAAAATRRMGKRRKYSVFSPEETANFIEKNCYEKCGLVFGNEERGLTDKELSECSAAVLIPSDSAFPSLNLSHAVQILAYTIFTHFNNNDNEKQESSSTEKTRYSLKELEDLCSEITDLLRPLGFFKKADDSDLKIFLRDIFSRANINQKEGSKIINLFRKIRGMAKKDGV